VDCDTVYAFIYNHFGHAAVFARIGPAISNALGSQTMRAKTFANAYASWQKSEAENDNARL